MEFPDHCIPYESDFKVHYMIFLVTAKFNFSELGKLFNSSAKKFN